MKYHRFKLLLFYTGIIFVTFGLFGQGDPASPGMSELTPEIKTDIELAVKNDFHNVLKEIVAKASGPAMYDAIVHAFMKAKEMKGPKAGADLLWSLLKENLPQDAGAESRDLKAEFKDELIYAALRRSKPYDALDGLYFITAILPLDIFVQARQMSDKLSREELQSFLATKLPYTYPSPLKMGWRWVTEWQDHSPVAIDVMSPIKRYPIVLIFDQKNQGGLRTIYVKDEDMTGCDVMPVDAFFIQFMASIIAGNKAVIASRKHTCGLLSLMENIPEFQGFDSATFASHPDYDDLRSMIHAKWDVYLVPNAAFAVWLPKEYANYYSKIFNIKNFQHFNFSDVQDILKECPTIAQKGQLANWPGMKTFHVDDLRKIFNAANIKENDVLDVLIGGHGTSGEAMAGLPIKKELTEHKSQDEQIQAVFDFFNTVNTGFVLVRSCFAGGPNITLLQAQDVGVVHDYGYNYVLIIAGAEDAPIEIGSTSAPRVADEFFANTGDRGTGLNELLIGLGEVLPGHPAEAGAKGFKDAPIVLLPGGFGFQTIQLRDDVRVIGRTAKTVHELEKRPIQIDKGYAVLWYVSEVNVPVEVSPVPAFDPQRQQEVAAAQWRALPMSMQQDQFNKLVSQISSQPDLVKQRYPALSFLAGDKDKLQEWLWQSHQAYFSDFAVMAEVPDHKVTFKKIVVRDHGNPLMGVGRFLRDAMGDVGSGVFQKTFVIKELEGINDLPFYMEMSRYAAAKGDLSKENSSITEFEQKLTETVGQPITLKNVVVNINPPEHKGYLVFYIPIDGEYWSYKVLLEEEVPEGPEGAYRWKFEKTPDAEKRRLEKLVA